MKTVKQISIHVFFASILAASATASASETDDGTRPNTQKATELWKEPQDTTMAMNSADLYAWRLFVALNWPGNPRNCKADSKKQLGDDGYATWELWREVEQTFLSGAAPPQDWTSACRQAFQSTPKLKPNARALSSEGFFFDRPEGSPFSTLTDEDTRLNASAYSHIVENKLYNRDEQEKLVAAGVQRLSFPLNTKEVKANWLRIEEADKPRYHWVEVNVDGQIEIWGMVGLHIMTRDMPRWHWSTFEHVDNEARWPRVYPNAFRGWVVPSVDTASCPPDNLSCNRIPSGLGLEGTKWENYRLRGSQIDWVDNRGNPTILPNSKIEGDFDQHSMSCMTCHALAVKGLTNDEHFPINLNPGVNDMGLPMGHVGAPDPALFKDENGNPIPYLELDFMWSLRHAQREPKP